MCMGKPKPAPTPAPAPPPPADPPAAPIVDKTNASDQSVASANRAGRGSLRVDLAQSVGSSGSGLNIPV